MIRGVIFDHDGTLVDSEGLHYAMWDDLLQQWGVQLSEKEYRTQLAGVPTRGNVDYLLRHYSQIPLSAEELFARREQVAVDVFCQQTCDLIRSEERRVGKEGG